MFELVAIDHEVFEVVDEARGIGTAFSSGDFFRRRLLQASDLGLPESVREVWEWRDLEPCVDGDDCRP